MQLRYTPFALKNTQFTLSIQVEDQAISDYLLKIFRVSIPHMPKTAAKFGQELQLALQPMILKPSGAGGLMVCASDFLAEEV